MKQKGTKKKGTAQHPPKKTFGSATTYAPGIKKVPLVGGKKK